MNKSFAVLLATALCLGLALCGCKSKSRTPATTHAASGKNSRTGDRPDNKSGNRAKGLFGTLASDLCSPDQIPLMPRQIVEFSVRLRSTDLMLDLEDLSLEQRLTQAYDELENENLAGALRQELKEHPLETCQVSEEKMGCNITAEDLSVGGGGLFTADAVQNVFSAMDISACGYLVVDSKLQGREPLSQKFLVGKSRGTWQLLTEMPEMR